MVVSHQLSGSENFIEVVETMHRDRLLICVFVEIGHYNGGAGISVGLLGCNVMRTCYPI